MDDPKTRHSTGALLQNWTSIVGIALAAGGFFADLCLIAFDFVRGFSAPYMGILVYILLPSFIWAGFVLIGLGMWLKHKKLKREAGLPSLPFLDLNDPRQRRKLIAAIAGGFVFLMATTVGSFKAYEFTDSVTFCGSLCHTVMSPEKSTYQNSPHAKVLCTACHIGPGASWFVRSKISGLYQVYAVLTHSYETPIPVPVKDLRPARETCEECHWPDKFYGSVERAYRHFLQDKDNTAWNLRLLVKVGGANPTHGPVGGIHWHMIVDNKIEYISDETRQKIPWVRLTNRKDGRQVVYESKDNPLPPDQQNKEIRVMDCIDCHNRPTHIFNPPNHALDVAMWLNRIDPSIPNIKENAARALVESAGAPTQVQGVRQVADKLGKEYADYNDRAKIQQAVSATQEIFSNNFFPEMKTSWKSRPDNIGHKIWPGCFRCHDGSHVSKDNKTISNTCASCHTIIAQGKDSEQNAVSLTGLEFDHPGGEIPEGTLCSECHTGAPQ